MIFLSQKYEIYKIFSPKSQNCGFDIRILILIIEKTLILCSTNLRIYESTNLRIYESTNEHKQTTKDRFQTWTTVNIFFWSIQQKYNFSKDNFSNVKTGEPIVPKFCVGPHVAPEKVYNWSKFQIFASIKIRFLLNFWKFWTFFVCFTIYTKRTCSQLK